MNPLEKFKAGSIIRYPDGKLDYLIFIPNENGLWVNACNPEWVRQGRKRFGEECYPFFVNEMYEGAEVVGHFGDGSLDDARRWFEGQQDGAE